MGGRKPGSGAQAKRVPARHRGRGSLHCSMPGTRVNPRDTATRSPHCSMVPGPWPLAHGPWPELHLGELLVDLAQLAWSSFPGVTPTAGPSSWSSSWPGLNELRQLARPEPLVNLVELHGPGTAGHCAWLTGRGPRPGLRDSWPSCAAGRIDSEKKTGHAAG